MSKKLARTVAIEMLSNVRRRAGNLISLYRELSTTKVRDRSVKLDYLNPDGAYRRRLPDEYALSTVSDWAELEYQVRVMRRQLDELSDLAASEIARLEGR